MRKKLIWLNLITIFLLISVLTGLGNMIYRQSMAKDRLLYITELQRQLSNSFAIKMQSVECSMEALAKHPAVLQWLLQAQNPSNEKQVRDLFLQYGEIYPEYLNILLVAGDGKAYLSNDSYRRQGDSFLSEAWFWKSMEGESLYYEFYNASRNLQSWKTYDNHSYVSIAKAVSLEGERQGVLLLDVSLGDLQALYRDLEPDTGNFFFLMDSVGNVILSPRNPIVHRIRPSWFEGKETGILEVDILSKQYKLLYHHFEQQKLRIVGVYDMARERDTLYSILKTNLGIALTAFVLAILISALYMSRVTKPLRQLADLMKQASKGNFDLRFNEPCDAEIQQLGEAFNKMTVKIKSLLGLVYQEQRQKREAELAVMQEQIKPHFLYNTLDLIAWMARKHGAQDILHIIERMSSFFRISLSKGKEKICLEEEVQMVASYLDIQSLRYQDLFDYFLYCEDGAKDAKVPRMCLQPLVENCLYHGIKESDNEKSLLSVSAYCIEGGIEIIVEDNGKGIADETMEHLNACLSTNDWSEWTGGFGVKNIGLRLWHSFAKGSGLRFRKTAEGFTQACLTILYEEG